MFSSCFPDLEANIHDETRSLYSTSFTNQSPRANELNLSAMTPHWAIQSCAFTVLLFSLGFSKLFELPTDFCGDPRPSPALVKMATWVGVCFPYTKTHIPSVLTSRELHQPVATILPDSTEMVENKVGKISKMYECLLGDLTTRQMRRSDLRRS